MFRFWQQRNLGDERSAKEWPVVDDFDFDPLLEDRGAYKMRVRHEFRPVVPNETERPACIGSQNLYFPGLPICHLNDAGNVATHWRPCRSQRGNTHDNGEG